jgi:hypothetical protein
MKIFVLTRGRPTEMQTTASALSGAGLEFTFARTRGDDTPVSVAGGSTEWFDCKTAAHKRQAIYDSNQMFIMLDDDLKFYSVVDGRPRAASGRDVADLISYAAHLMQSNGLVGLADRLWIVNKPRPYVRSPTKVYHFFGINKLLLSGKERFDRFPGHSDIDFSLQVLTSGASVVAITKFCYTDLGQGTRPGGASIWRTTEENDRLRRMLRKTWPGIIEIYKREDGVEQFRVNHHALKKAIPK